LRAESVSTPSRWRTRFRTDSNLRAGNRCSTWALSPEPPKRVWLRPPTRLRCCGEEERASILRLCIHVHTREYLIAKLSLRWTLCHPTPALTHSSCHPTRLCRGDPSGASLSCAPQCKAHGAWGQRVCSRARTASALLPLRPPGRPGRRASGRSS